MAEGIVDLLEVIDVGEQQGKNAAMPLHPGALGLEAVHQFTAIGQPGQGIGLGGAVQIILQAQAARAFQQGLLQMQAIDRLGDILVDADIDRILEIIDLLEGGQQDNRNFPVDGADLPGHLQAVPNGHEDIGKNHVWRLVMVDRQPLLAVAGDQQVADQSRKKTDELRPHLLLILHIEEGEPLQKRLILFIDSRHGCSASGRATENSHPPSILRTVMVPCILRSMIVLDI